MTNPKLGVDLAGPDLSATVQGDLALSVDVANVAGAMRRRLNTPKGKLFAHPDYGNSIYDILSDNIDDTWIGKAKAALQDCLALEPRISVEGIDVTVYPENRQAIFTISYTILDAPGAQNLVWEADLAA